MMSVDRLSELPDDILCYILSFLETKEAAITSLLSKRWQFLWTQLPFLRFEEDLESDNAQAFVNRINRSLAICTRRNLERFEVYFIAGYDECFAADVNVWITFAVNKNVKQFSLLLSGYHMLPRTTYSNPSWTSLSLQGCSMAPRGTIQWQSLTELRMNRLELNENAFDKMFSGCPVLSSLKLVLCRGFDRLEVSSPSLRTLTVEDDGNDEGCLEISAPYLRTLKIRWHCLYKYFRLQNMKSLVRAKIDGAAWIEIDPECCKKGIKDLFERSRHVEMIKLGRRFTKVLPLIAQSWQLPQSTTKCLELDVTHDERSIPGIALLLESSPNLETLVIHSTERYWDDFEVVPSSKNDLNCDLLYLKKVCIKTFGDPNHDNGKLMLTLARILLKRAIILEEMVINFQEISATPSAAFYEMTRKLLSYPRISKKAVVLFN